MLWCYVFHAKLAAQSYICKGCVLVEIEKFLRCLFLLLPLLPLLLLLPQLGDAYHSLLDLPCDLNPSSDRTLDEQLQLLHGVISRALRQYGLTSYDDCQGDGGDSGCFGGAGGGGGAGESSDVSGCHGGVCGAVDDDLVDPEE
jgi:hypothetical protein